MPEETLDRSALAPTSAPGRTSSAVVSTVAITLAHEFPHLPLGSVIAMTVRSLRDLQRVPLTALRDASFNDVFELVEEQTRQALRRRDEQRPPANALSIVEARDDDGLPAGPEPTPRSLALREARD